jgi:hypothetical protein
VFTGNTTSPSSSLLLRGSDLLFDVTNGGAMSVVAGATATFGRVTNTSSGRITLSGTSNAVPGTVNATEFVSNGLLAVNPFGVFNHTTPGADMILGAGSITNVGIYNSTTGGVTFGGTINLGDNNMVITGGLVRNNGFINSNNGNIIVDFGGVLRGIGVNNVNSIVLRNGGQFIAGNSPGLSPQRNVDMQGGSTLSVQMSNVTGIPGSGDPNGASNANGSGWGVIEYGATSTTSGRLTILATPSNKAIFKMTTVTDVPPRNNPAPPINFDPNQSYTWPVFRPGTAAGFNVTTATFDPAQFNNFTTVNTVAPLTITDATTNQTFTGAQLNDSLLNTYLRFDTIDWNFGSTPPSQQGTFSFTFLPDTFGTPNRIIAVVYTPVVPVPEPAAVLAVCGVAALGWRRWRRKPTAVA